MLLEPNPTTNLSSSRIHVWNSRLHQPTSRLNRPSPEGHCPGISVSGPESRDRRAGLRPPRSEANRSMLRMHRRSWRFHRPGFSFNRPSPEGHCSISGFCRSNSEWDGPASGFRSPGSESRVAGF